MTITITITINITSITSIIIAYNYIYIYIYMYAGLQAPSGGPADPRSARRTAFAQARNRCLGPGFEEARRCP